LPAADVPAVLGELRFGADAVYFEPRFPFVAGLSYTARFQLPGLPRLLRTFEVEAPSGERPRVTAVFPTADTLPENALRLYVHFSQPMETRAARHVRLLDEQGSEIKDAFVAIFDGLWDPQQTRLTLLFHPGRIKRGVGPGETLGPPLREGGAYRLVVDGIQSARGMPLAAPFERRFRAAPADRSSPRFEDLRVSPPDRPDAPLVVVFPEPLDEALLQRLVWVEDLAGGRVEGGVEIGANETSWRFQPAQPWRAGEYAVRVHPALEDRAGNRFDRAFDRAAAARDQGAASVPRRIPVRITF